MDFELSLLIALVPPAVLIFFIWKVDKLEREPIKLILLVLGLGALSGLLACGLEIALDYPISAIAAYDEALYLVIDNFFGVALVEEGVKILVIFLVVWRHKEFNCMFDGVVYGVASSLGFAALENVKYVLYYGIGTGVVRAFTAIPGHCIFGIFMGALLGMAMCCKADGKQRMKRILLFAALAVPTFIHGYYDYLLSVPDYMSTAANAIWWVYLVAIAVAAFFVVKKMAKNDRVADKTMGYSGEALPAANTAAPLPASAAQAYGVPQAAGTVAPQPYVYVPKQ